MFRLTDIQYLGPLVNVIKHIRYVMKSDKF